MCVYKSSGGSGDGEGGVGGEGGGGHLVWKLNPSKTKNPPGTYTTFRVFEN